METDRPPDKVLDELLVLRAQAGDREAFAALVGRWQGRLLRHALHLADGEDGARDVVQEGWLAIARGLSRLADPACFPRWAYGVVTRKAADRVRRLRRDRALVDRLADSAPEPERPGPGGDPADGRVESLREALRLLPGDRRALLAMVYLDGLSVSEASEALGIPPGTVKSRLHHARRELGAILERRES